MSDQPQVVIYTDGGCRPNPGKGAWAAILVYGDHRRELVGSEMETTNNRMELLAAISALEALKKPCQVSLHTDSEYVRNGITSWIHNWKRNGWKSKSGPVKNKELWQRLDAAIRRHKVEWVWVKGHADDELNNRCDELCTAAIDELERGG
jgi:ribonuclease HI